jgi:hypothetical protein
MLSTIHDTLSELILVPKLARDAGLNPVFGPHHHSVAEPKGHPLILMALLTEHPPDLLDHLTRTNTG